MKDVWVRRWRGARGVAEKEVHMMGARRWVWAMGYALGPICR
jgi:hypothetical protein